MPRPSHRPIAANGAFPPGMQRIPCSITCARATSSIALSIDLIEALEAIRAQKRPALYRAPVFRRNEPGEFRRDQSGALKLALED